MTRAERLSIAGAATAHLVLLAALSLAWQNSQKMLAAPTDAVPVEIVDISDAPRTPEPPKPSMEAAPQEAAAAAPEAETAPEPEPVKPDAVPPPEPTKPTPPKPKAATPTKAPPSPLDTSTLANLIDKALPKAAKKPLDTSKLAKELNAAAPARATIDPRAAATLAQAIRAQVYPCWNPSIGGRDVSNMSVTVTVRYGPDGKVVGQPKVGTPIGTTTGNSDYARAFADGALRAVLRCQPLRLPPELYQLLEGGVIINFDPKEIT